MKPKGFDQFQIPTVRFFGLALGMLYIVRAMMGDAEGFAPLLVTLEFACLGVFFLIAAYLSEKGKSPELICFLMALACTAVEGHLAWTGYLSYVQYFVLIPILTIFVSLLSGMLLGVIIGCLAMSLGAGLILLPAEKALLFTAKPDMFRVSYFFYLIGAEFFIVALIYYFQKSLRSSQQELGRRRVSRIRSSRRVAVADAIGKAAHELNNPIAIVDSALRLLKSRSRDIPEKKILLTAMDDALQRLSSVVGSIQTFVDGDLKEELRRVTVQELVTEFQNQSEEKLRAFGGTLEVHNLAADRQVSCRPNQILFVLSVLLENALEASTNGSKHIRFFTRPQDRKVRFEVEDRGQGIPEDMSELIFTPFHSTKNVGQTLGMNLSLCRVFIEERGGSIGFSRLTRGTLFWFEIPE